MDFVSKQKKSPWRRCAKFVQRYFPDMSYCQAIDWIRNNYCDEIPFYTEKHMFDILCERFNHEAN